MCSNESDNDETLANSHFQSAWKAFKSGDSTGALSYLDTAVSLASDAATKSAYLATKGGFLNRLGLPERAIVLCEEAVTLVPKNYHAWSQMGLAFLRLERYEDAARCFSEVVRLQPNHGLYTLLARAQVEFDPMAALKSAEKALELQPSWDEAVRVRELAQRRVGELNK